MFNNKPGSRTPVSFMCLNTAANLSCSPWGPALHSAASCQSHWLTEKRAPQGQPVFFTSLNGPEVTFVTGSTFTSLKSCYSIVREVEGYARMRVCLCVCSRVHVRACSLLHVSMKTAPDVGCLLLHSTVFFFIFMFNQILEASDPLDLEL